MVEQVVSIPSPNRADAEMAIKILEMVPAASNLDHAARQAAIAVVLCYFNRLAPPLPLFKEDDAKATIDEELRQFKEHMTRRGPFPK